METGTIIMMIIIFGGLLFGFGFCLYLSNKHKPADE